MKRFGFILVVLGLFAGRGGMAESVPLSALGLDTQVETMPGEVGGGVRLVSQNKLLALAEDFSDVAAFKMYHYGDPQIIMTQEDAFGFDADTGTITSYSVAVGGLDVVVPYIIGGQVVTFIGPKAFLTLPIENIVFPKTVVRFQNNSFQGCSNLVSMISPSVEVVQTGSFNYCYSLERVSFESCVQINTYAFFDCIALKEVHIPNVERVQSRAFMNCRSLKTINLSAVGRNNRGIGEALFVGCTNLLSVTWSELDPVEWESKNIYGQDESDPSMRCDLAVNYVDNPRMPGWGETFNGRPVVRGSLSADELYLNGDAVSELLGGKLKKSGGTMTGPLKLAESGVTWQGVNIATNFTIRAEFDGTNVSFNVYTEAK